MNVNCTKISECILLEKNRFPNKIETERLVLKKQDFVDNSMTIYSIYLYSNKMIGDIACLFDGEIMYKIREEYRNNGYITEALTRLIEINNKEYYLTIENGNTASKKVAKKLGFKKVKKMANSAVYSNIS